MKNKELLEQVRKDKQRYISKQYSKNPYYVLLRIFGADWWWTITTLAKLEEGLEITVSTEKLEEGK